MSSTTEADAILVTLEAAYRVVKRDAAPDLSLDDDLVQDLQLDSLDMVDLVSILEEDFPPAVIDAVIDRSPEITTVAELVAAFVAAS
jgi:acyl carrier protein